MKCNSLIVIYICIPEREGEGGREGGRERGREGGREGEYKEK